LHRSKASDPGCFGLPQRLGNADLVRSRGDLCDAFLQARYSLAALADIFDGGEKRRSTAVKGAKFQCACCLSGIFQCAACSVWNCLKTPFLVLPPVLFFNIDRAASLKGASIFMIVCSCNVLSDDDVRNAVSASEDLPRHPKQIYGCLGCSAECGRCARTIKSIIDDALGACARACHSGCPHSATESAGSPRELPVVAAA